MTSEQAKSFAEDWMVVSHQPNSATGLSATLFKLKPGRADASKGTYEGQYVVSFRSTEFVEDYARDTRQADQIEVGDGGWAYGQIADMQTWWKSPAVQAAIGSSKVDVTGYSLGGHLAAAFYDLNKDRVNKVYTFNAAGVGGLVGQNKLSDVIAEFSRRRNKGQNGDLFTDQVAHEKYSALVEKFYFDESDNSGPDITSGKLSDAITDVLGAINQAMQDSVDLGGGGMFTDRIKQLRMLKEALENALSISDAAEYAVIVPDGGVLNQIVFGGTGGDAFSGAGDKDSLFGGAGNDTLAGLDGQDYLEGNAGDDSLEGGDGNDVLLGGQGSDVLDGGRDIRERCRERRIATRTLFTTPIARNTTGICHKPAMPGPYAGGVSRRCGRESDS